MSQQVSMKMKSPRTLKFSKRKPLVWYFIRRKFPATDPEKIVIAFGDTIYTKWPINSDLTVHEAVHLRDQKYSNFHAWIWWWRYLRNPKFRMEQELRAYRMQYKFLTQGIKDKNHLDKRLRIMAKTLSGDTYGRLMGVNEAMKLISL